MSHELADVLDLLRVAVQAGLSVGRALSEVGRRCNGPLADECSAAATRLQLGATRDAAFAELVARCPLDARRDARGRRRRAPTATARRSRRRSSRSPPRRAPSRRAACATTAARAAPKIQLVVALVLVPAVMLLVGAVLVQALT